MLMHRRSLEFLGERNCNVLDQPLTETEEYGRGIAPDNEGRAEMYMYRRTGNRLKKTRFCRGIIKYATKVIVHLDEGTEVWYCVVVENMYTREFFISEKNLMKPAEAFRTFSENGIIFSIHPVMPLCFCIIIFFLL